MWVVFYTRYFEDHYRVFETETEATDWFNQLVANDPHVYCAGVGPITNSTEHWHVPA